MMNQFLDTSLYRPFDRCRSVQVSLLSLRPAHARMHRNAFRDQKCLKNLARGTLPLHSPFPNMRGTPPSQPLPTMLTHPNMNTAWSVG